jgi:predicted RecB family endonuclease
MLTVRLIAHYDKDTTSADDIRKEMRGELKAKLSQTLSALQRKTEELKADLNVEEEMAGGMLFETDDPEKNKQVVGLFPDLCRERLTDSTRCVRR